jgi:beta-galactosidase
MDGGRYSCELWSDWITLEGAGVVASFADGWLAGRPAVTRKGGAWYVGTMFDREGMNVLVEKLLDETAVAPALETPPAVEAVRREAAGRSILFLLNHSERDATIELDRGYRDLITGEERAGTLRLDRFAVAVLQA